MDQIGDKISDFEDNVYELEHEDEDRENPLKKYK
jgi:predicted secreted acid phosphatase